MSDRMSLSQKCLVEIRIGNNHEKVHSAWQDDTNEGYLIWYEINLVFDDNTIYSIRPCEVEIDGRYPGLGLTLEKIDEATLTGAFDISSLPMKVERIDQSDFLGEDTINQYVLVFTNDSKVIIRHVFPPMTMGIKTEAVNA